MLILISHYWAELFNFIRSNHQSFEYLLVVFLLNSLSTTIGNLKSVFLNKRLVKPLYVTTFIDALVCAYALRILTTSSGWSCVLAFALGRIGGAWLGDRIEERLALGTMEVSVYKHPEEGAGLAERLRQQGYSATSFLGQGAEGRDRMVITVIVPRRELDGLKRILEAEGQLNMAIHDISKTYGKVGSIQPRAALN